MYIYEKVYLNHSSYFCPEVFLLIVYLILALLELNFSCLHRKAGGFATKNKCCIKLWLLQGVRAGHPNVLKFSHSVYRLSIPLCLQLVNNINWLAAFITEVFSASCKCYFYVIRELSQFYGNYLDHSGAFVFDCNFIRVSYVLSAPVEAHEGVRIL